MRKSEFLQDPDVGDILAWLPERFESNDTFVHAYVDRQTGQVWSCNGLFEAFRSYQWNDKSWTDNKAELDDFRRRLRRAVDAGDQNEAVACSEHVLRWGGVIARNGAALATRRDTWLDELRHMRTVLTAEQEPSTTDLLRVPGEALSACRMNAGFVKIYSVLLDSFVIYDGRVGAGLGLLVRRFCESTGRRSVPTPLAFAYGAPKEDPNTRNPKTRNPSAGPYRFPKLRPDSRFHAAQAMRASWFLQEAVAQARGPFSPGEDGVHELAAGLFMVGYDLPAGAAAA